LAVRLWLPAYLYARSGLFDSTQPSWKGFETS
jgi:hypothetical protein